MQTYKFGSRLIILSWLLKSGNSQPNNNKRVLKKKLWTFLIFNNNDLLSPVFLDYPFSNARGTNSKSITELIRHLMQEISRLVHDVTGRKYENKYGNILENNTGRFQLEATPNDNIGSKIATSLCMFDTFLLPGSNDSAVRYSF